MSPSAVLFLCTGNYFRSRFAEHFFNHHAKSGGLPLAADSRGIAIELGHANVGPISPFTLEGLARHGIVPPKPLRYPLALGEADLAAAAHVIAVKEAEHRPMLARKFPEWADRVEYWRVDDIDCARPAEAMALLEMEVGRLLERLAVR
jgi:protein-tyrosine phosphatase